MSAELSVAQEGCMNKLEPFRDGLSSPSKTTYAICGNCRFWQSQKVWNTHDTETPGDCHRHAPAPVAFDPDAELDGWSQNRKWPGTYINQWCGEHQPHPDLMAGQGSGSAAHEQSDDAGSAGGCGGTADMFNKQGESA